MERPLTITDPDIPWDLTRPEASEVALRNQQEAIHGDAPADAMRSVSLLTQIARAEAMQGKLSDAERTLDRAAKQLGASDEVEPRLRLLLERGRLFALKHTPVQARECFLEVWNVARRQGQLFHAIDAAQMMSVVETPKQRNPWTVLALDLAEGSADARARRWRGDLHLTLGRYYESMLQLPKSIESFERAVTCFNEDGAVKKAWIAKSFIARVYRLSKRTEEALHLQEAALRELGQSRPDAGMVFEELAECSLVLKRSEEAERYFMRAYEAVCKDDWFVINEAARLKRFKTLGKVK